MFPNELINFINIKKKNMSSNNSTKDRNPLIGIITPEWHYSDSIRILQGINFNWDNLDNINEVYKVSNNLNIPIKDSNLPEVEKKFAGWYQPYHFLPREKWGIHIRYSKWIEISSLLYKTCPNLHISKAASKAGILYLYTHLLFHYIVENVASILEIITNSYALYKEYLNKIYCEFFNSSNCIEESLANYYLLEKSDNCHIDKNYLRQSLSLQGDGYRDFANFTDQNFRLGIRSLLAQIKYGITRMSHHEPIEQIIDLYNPFNILYGHDIPIWLHKKAKPLYQKII